MALTARCPHCSAHSLAHAFWQSVCTTCGKWTGVEPPQPAEVLDGTDRSVDVDTPVAAHSNLISALALPVQATTPPEYVRPEPEPVPEPVAEVSEVVVPDPPTPPAEAPVAE